MPARCRLAVLARKVGGQLWRAFHTSSRDCDQLLAPSHCHLNCALVHFASQVRWYEREPSRRFLSGELFVQPRVLAPQLLNMNNSQFRKLMLANSEQARNSKDAGAPEAQKAGGGASLGSRLRSSIPMTP